MPKNLNIEMFVGLGRYKMVSHMSSLLGLTTSSYKCTTSTRTYTRTYYQMMVLNSSGFSMFGI